jgi:hypothetical protein
VSSSENFKDIKYSGNSSAARIDCLAAHPSLLSSENDAVMV